MIRTLCRWLHGAPSDPHKVSVSQGIDGQFYWRERAVNGEITCSSEGFTRLADAERAAKAHVEAGRIFVSTKAVPNLET